MATEFKSPSNSSIKIEITGDAATALAGLPAAWVALEQAHLQLEQAQLEADGKDGEARATLLQGLLPLVVPYLESVLGPKRSASCSGADWKMDPLGAAESGILDSEAYSALCRAFGYLVPVEVEELLDCMNRTENLFLFSPASEPDLKIIFDHLKKENVAAGDLLIAPGKRIPLHTRGILSSALSCFFGAVQEAAPAFVFALSTLEPMGQDQEPPGFWFRLASSPPDSIDALSRKPQTALLAHMLERLGLERAQDLLAAARGLKQGLPPAILSRVGAVLDEAVSLYKKSESPLPDQRE